jgi:hypothetical protein
VRSSMTLPFNTMSARLEETSDPGGSRSRRREIVDARFCAGDHEVRTPRRLSHVVRSASKSLKVKRRRPIMLKHP